MEKPTLIFEHSPLFLVLCALVGLVYAYLLYQKSGPWGPTFNKLLFALRFVLATVITSLLVSPVLKQIQNTIEAPTYVFAIDNSSSVASSIDSTVKENVLSKLQEIGTQYANNGFEVEYRTISGERYESLPESVSYTHTESDISGFLDDIAFDFEGRNLAGVTLISDGIYNQGIAPTFKELNYKLTSIGIGDTVPKSDVSITSLAYNKISYQGNKFPVVVQFVQKGFAGDQAVVTVSKDGVPLETERVTLNKDNQLNEVNFLLEAKQKGFQRYTVRIKPLPNEFTTLNNTKQVYVEVIEGKENIAMVAAAPHPDIKAIRYAIESNANYSFDQYILSLPEDPVRLGQSSKKYDLVIYHQLPSTRSFPSLVSKFEDEKIPSLTIFGNATNLRSFNQQNGVLTLDAIPGEYDNVNPSFNQSFINFNLSEQLQQTFTELPPINVPFGKTNLNPGSKVMLYQQVGSIVTNKPLIAVNDEKKPKSAVVLGNGLWKWKLTSYVVTGNDDVFNELITKLVQFLSSKEDKRKFKAYPVKNEFTTNERVVFDTEIYNDLYERVYGNKVNLTLKNNDKEFNYTFITNENNTRYAISGLQDGVYQYRAGSTVGSQNVSTTGEFVIKDLQVEDINLTADFDLLRKLAIESGGEFYQYQQTDELLNSVKSLQAQGIIHSSEKYLPFINLKWLFFFFLLLISAEWFIRKFNGSY